MITISNDSLTATIDLKGAELISLKAGQREYIWEGNPDFWGKHSPILFPIVGTLKNNSYTYNGNKYSMSRHGFARDNIFRIKEQSDDSVTLSLLSDKNTLLIFPFEFELDLKYTLKNNTLLLDYTVVNNGNNIMPFSIGAHPAFALPGDFSSYSLKFEKNETLVSTELENDLLSSKTLSLPTNNGELPLSYNLFEKDALILKNIKSKSIDIMQKKKSFLKVTYQDFPHLGIWTKDNAPFLCIEPWHGYSDTFITDGNFIKKESIILLKSNHTFNTGFNIQILD